MYRPISAPSRRLEGGKRKIPPVWATILSGLLVYVQLTQSTANTCILQTAQFHAERMRHINHPQAGELNFAIIFAARLVVVINATPESSASMSCVGCGIHARHTDLESLPHEMILYESKECIRLDDRIHAQWRHGRL